jgi:selenocysteine lyase/cysteine desulfurase
MTNLDARNHEDTDIIYLDNAATTFPKPASVYKAADEFYRRFGGNAGRGGNPLARACTRLLAETREQLAAWLDVPTPEQVIFTSSATHALNLAILGTHPRPSDTIYVSPFEHNSVLRPVEHLRQTRGVQVQKIPFSRRTYTCQLDKLTADFQVAPPAIVCITQASNVCGVMPPVLDIARLAKAANPQAVIVVDGAQTAGLYPLPLTDNLIDAFIFSGHKSLYGPYGVAGLVLASDWRPSPLLFGGTGTISESIQMPTDLPSAYEAGSHNIWAIAGLHAALNWLQETRREVIVAHTMELAGLLRDGLSNLQGLELHTPPPDTPWCGILSFSMDGTTPQTIESALGAQNIAVRAGLHCAPRIHEWLGTMGGGGTTRISYGGFNSETEINSIIYFLSNIL